MHDLLSRSDVFLEAALISPHVHNSSFMLQRLLLVSTTHSGSVAKCSHADACFWLPQLAFKRWTERRYWDVVAIYEDRHEVAVLGAGGRIMRKSIPFKRTKVLSCASQV